MNFVDVERARELVGHRYFGMPELVIRLGEDGRAVAIVLQHASEGIAAKFPASLLFLHREFIEDSVTEIGNEAFPNAGAATPFHRMGVAIPVVEATHDRDALSVGCPYGKAHAALDEMSAQKSVRAAILSFIEEIEVEFRYRAHFGGVRRRWWTWGLGLLRRHFTVCRFDGDGGLWQQLAFGVG